MKHFYTDGVKTIKLNDGDVIPEGFHKGRTFNVNTWNKGLNKEDPRVAKNTSKCHKTRRERNNYNSWNKGLTKEISESLNTVSIKLKDYKKENPMTEKQKTIMVKHINETKRKNNSFHISKPEEDYYQKLILEYGEADIKRNDDTDPRYPFKYDFYIISKDLFIELNYTWQHQNHPFNKDDLEDQKILELWKEKAKTSNNYNYAIKVWTQSDPLKLKTLRDNKCNFIIIYPNDLIIQK